MGRRSRKRTTSTGRVAAAEPPVARPEPRPSRSEQRAAEIREGLEPLAPGERPTPVTIAAVVSAVIAVANPVAYAAGLQIRGQQPAVVGILVLTALMVACAVGLWRARYWAVLGFQVLLAITIVYAALSLLVASSVRGVVICVVLMGLGGWLFYKLIRAMARIQMPQRP